MFPAANRHTAQAPTAPPRRGGFSLVELMVVIVIIGILMALLLPALGDARTSARVRTVSTEISDFEAALANFKGKFGMFPPSSITLYEDASGWNADARSRGFVRRMWTNFDFQYSFAPTPGQIDLDGDGTAGEADPDGDTIDGITLNGPECLVFFLGGFRDTNGAMVGFSKNPANPWTTSGENREGPFFEFDLARLIDQNNNSFPEYVDALASQVNPYLYLSSYDGRGYLPDESGLPAGSFDVYRTGPNPTDPPYKDQSFQVISPGFNTEYGNGGHFNAQDPNASVDLEEVERDNITNFHKNMLIP